MKNIFKILNLFRCPEFSMCSRYNFEKSYLHQKAYFLIVYVSKINFKKPKIKKKNMESNLKSHLLFYFFKKLSGVQNWVKIESP